MMIKNLTPYKGKLKIKFEKDPEYTGSNSGLLNKVHIDLGFTKLVTRMIPNKNLDGWEIDLNKVNLIEEFTDGKIGFHEWWVIKQDGKTETVNSLPKDSAEIVFYGSLPNSFLSKSGKYIGDIQRAWWYYNNNLKVCEEYPLGVAKQYENGKLVGYYGYTHRGGSSFKIGDRLFESDYTPKEEDYEIWEWFGWEDNFNRRYEESDEFGKKCMDEDGIKCVIPYNKRGSKVIETLGEALEASINLSKELS